MANGLKHFKCDQYMPQDGTEYCVNELCDLVCLLHIDYDVRKKIEEAGETPNDSKCLQFQPESDCYESLCNNMRCVEKVHCDIHVEPYGDN